MTAAVAGAGFAAGVVAKAADESGIGWASDLGTHPAIWVAALAVIARFAPTVRWATLRAVGFFVVMCLGYYGWAVVALGFGSGPALTRFLVLWLAMSVTAVPVAAAGMHLAYARDGPVPGAAVASVAGLALLTGGAVWR
nr:hypothetical protein [Actinomycetota bacterium]